MGALQGILDRFGQSQFDRRVKYVTPVKKKEAEGLLADLYTQMSRDFGLVAEPVVIHSSDPQLTAASWAVTRETVVAGAAPRVAKEIVAREVSKSNQCSYCAAAHQMMVDATDGQPAGSGTANGLDLDAVASWAAVTSEPDSAILKDPPFSSDLSASMIGTAVSFQYINRMVEIFLPNSPIPFPGIDGIGQKMGSAILGSVVKAAFAPGESLKFLADAELPSELGWAQGEPAVAGAFARMARESERVGQAALSSATRELVDDKISTWRGEPMPLSRNWVEEDISGLQNDERAEAKLALLTALAPHQVDEEVIADYRANKPGDAALIGATNWAARKAATRVGSWLTIPARSEVA